MSKNLTYKQKLEKLENTRNKIDRKIAKLTSKKTQFLLSQIVDCTNKQCEQISNFKFTNYYVRREYATDYDVTTNGSFSIKYTYMPIDTNQKIQHVSITGSYTFSSTYSNRCFPSENINCSININDCEYDWDLDPIDDEEDELEPIIREEPILNKILSKYEGSMTDIMRLEIKEFEE